MSDDPFQKLKEELEQMDLPEPAESETLEERLRRKLSENKIELTPDEAIDEHERRLNEEVSRASRPEIPDIPDFDSRLRQLETKAHASKNERRLAEEKLRKERADTAETSRGLGVGLAVAYSIIGFPLFGALIGWGLDTYLHMMIWKSILVLGGCVLGIVAAVMIINRHSGLTK
ncbi:MAG: AtpZ/AtpI family protein [Luteolibacter sp.]